MVDYISLIEKKKKLLSRATGAVFESFFSGVRQRHLANVMLTVLWTQTPMNLLISIPAELDSNFIVYKSTFYIAGLNK